MILVKLILIIVALCLIWAITVIFREKDDIYEEASVDYPELMTVGLVIVVAVLGIASIALITVAVMI
jgi:hypothetical protein